MVEDAVADDADDSVDQVVAVLEIVVELAAAGARSCPDVVQTHASGAFLGDEFGCSLQDPLTRHASLRRCGSGVTRHHFILVDFGLDSPEDTGLLFGLISPIRCTSMKRGQQMIQETRPSGVEIPTYFRVCDGVRV